MQIDETSNGGDVNNDVEMNGINHNKLENKETKGLWVIFLEPKNRD